MQLTDLEQYKTMIGTGVGSAVVLLLAGKTLRRLLLLPFKLLAEKTKTKEDDLLVEEAARDLDLPPDAAPPVDLKEDK